MPDQVDIQVAEHLRALRAERGVTLTALADQTGISVAHLSRLEKGERQPSIGSLLQLARAYGVSLSHLVEAGEDNGYHLVRAADVVVHEGPDGRYAVLSGTRAAISVVRLVIAAGGRTAEARHVGEEWLHVLSGAAMLTVASEEIHLRAGDSIHFDSARPHGLATEGHMEVTVLIGSISGATPMHHPVPRAARDR